MDEAHQCLGAQVGFLRGTHKDMQVCWQEACRKHGLSIGDATLSEHKLTASVGSLCDEDKGRAGLPPSESCSPPTGVPRAPELLCTAHRMSPSTGVLGTGESWPFSLFFLGVLGALPFRKPSSYKSKSLASKTCPPRGLSEPALKEKSKMPPRLSVFLL